MDRHDDAAVRAGTEAQESVQETLKSIQDQTRQTLELVRSLISLLLAKEGGREGPTLEGLIASLIAQQRDALTGIMRIQEDVSAIAIHLLGADGSQQAVQAITNSRTRT